eukprot:31176-Pelagococcus_subviridis.AAC.40
MKNPADCGSACPMRLKKLPGVLMMFSSCENSVPANMPPANTFNALYSETSAPWKSAMNANPYGITTAFQSANKRLGTHAVRSRTKKACPSPGTSLQYQSQCHDEPFAQSDCESETMLLVKMPMGNTTRPAIKIAATSHSVFELTSSGAGAELTFHGRSPPGSCKSVCAATAADTCDLNITMCDNAERGLFSIAFCSSWMCAKISSTCVEIFSRLDASFAASFDVGRVHRRRSSRRSIESCVWSSMVKSTSIFAWYRTGTVATKSSNKRANVRDTCISAACVAVKRIHVRDEDRVLLRFHRERAPVRVSAALGLDVHVLPRVDGHGGVHFRDLDVALFAQARVHASTAFVICLRDEPGLLWLEQRAFVVVHVPRQLAVQERGYPRRPRTARANGRRTAARARTGVNRRRHRRRLVVLVDVCFDRVPEPRLSVCAVVHEVQVQKERHEVHGDHDD